MKLDICLPHRIRCPRCNCIGPILLILLVIACIVFNCVLPVFNKEYDDDDGSRRNIVITCVEN